MNFSRKGRAWTLTLACLGLLAFAGSAGASHLKGGHINATFDAVGKVTVTMTWYQLYGSACTVDPDDAYDRGVAITGPGATTHHVGLRLVPTRCLGDTLLYEATGKYDLADPSTGSPFAPTPPNGSYVLTLGTCCRVGGIMNSPNSDSFSLATRVTYTAGSVSGSPRFVGSTATGAAQGFAYSGDVTAADPDSGGALGYQLLQQTDDAAPDYDPTAPTSNVVTLNGTRAEVPAATTGGWNVGDYFVYKIRATDAVGDWALLDILVYVTDNKPPTLTVPETITLTEGQALSVPVSATDPDADDVVTITQGASPPWATSSTTAGNPATGALALAPPAGAAGTYLIPFEAIDDDPQTTLLDSRVMRVIVLAPVPPAAPPAPVIAPPAPRPSVPANKAPSLASLRVTRSAFLPVGTAPNSSRPHGTQLRFSLSEAATVRFTVARTSGKHVSRFTVRGRRGANSVRFTGRVNGRALRPGSYVVTLRATDASGVRSATRTMRFVILGGAQAPRFTG
jgi:hypothetical protein